MKPDLKCGYTLPHPNREQHALQVVAAKETFYTCDVSLHFSLTIPHLTKKYPFSSTDLCTYLCADLIPTSIYFCQA